MDICRMVLTDAAENRPVYAARIGGTCNFCCEIEAASGPPDTP